MVGSVATTATISIQIGLNLNAATNRGKVSETTRSQDQYIAHAISSGGMIQRGGKEAVQMMEMQTA